MTDAAYVFNQDVRERSKIKQGAIHKKNGSKSKHCTLPSDHMTPKQKKSLNGVCDVIDLSEPIENLKVLRLYPSSLQQEYLQNLVNKYGARQIDVCTMLKTTPTNFKRYLDNHGLNIAFSKHRRVIDDRWLDFITKPKNCKEPEPIIEPIPEEINEEKVDIPVAQKPEVPEWKSELEKICIGAKNSASADAVYLKTFYDTLVDLKFSEDFAKILVQERAKSKFLY